MYVSISQDKYELGKKAAENGSKFIRKALAEKGYANIIVATGASQFEMLSELVKAPDIDWSKVSVFHLDEYVGLPEDHPAGFRKYLRERFIAKLPTAPKKFYPVSKEGMAELGAILKQTTIDVAFVGIGENGHLAFNDPPADFDSNEAYLIIELDEKCRRQQLGEGWFKTFEDVPTHAVSMAIKQIMMSKAIICSVPDARKAEAVAGAVEGPLSNLCPSSIMQMHPECWLYLDPDSAKLLKKSY
jgi:glucosamine-6-phosphate deaminase